MDPKRLNAVKGTLERPVPPLVNVLIQALAADLNVALAAVTILDATHQHFLSTNMGALEAAVETAASASSSSAPAITWPSTTFKTSPSGDGSFGA